MPKPIAILEQQNIVERHEQGESLAAIGRHLGRPYRSVWNVWQRYCDTGRIESHYRNCGRRGQISFTGRVYRGALMLRRLHPSWGAPLIRSLLGQKWADEPLPTVRTLQYWFRQKGLNQSPRHRQPVAPVRRGEAVHEVWALDSKEKIQLANGQAVSWLTLSDEKSGVVLAGTFSPLG
jgi:hypothetical protein